MILTGVKDTVKFCLHGLKISISINVTIEYSNSTIQDLMPAGQASKKSQRKKYTIHYLR